MYPPCCNMVSLPVIECCSFPASWLLSETGDPSHHEVIRVELSYIPFMSNHKPFKDKRIQYLRKCFYLGTNSLMKQGGSDWVQQCQETRIAVRFTSSNVGFIQLLLWPKVCSLWYVCKEKEGNRVFKKTPFIFMCIDNNNWTFISAYKIYIPLHYVVPVQKVIFPRTTHDGWYRTRSYNPIKYIQTVHNLIKIRLFYGSKN